MLFFRRIGVVGTLLVVASGVCSGEIVHVNQNWTKLESEEFWDMPHGSQLIPWSWFSCLEKAGGRGAFASFENLSKYGFVYRGGGGEAGELPIGFVKDGKLDWLGMNCAACHTAQISHGDDLIQIEGAPGMIDLDQFLIDLTEAIEATFNDAAKFQRFSDRVLNSKQSPSEEQLLKLKLRWLLDRRLAYNDRNHTGAGQFPPREPWGPGRIDAFGAILNQVTALRLQVEANAKPADAPVSIPFLWDTPQHDHVQWNGVASNGEVRGEEFGALGRNTGEVLGVFGEVRVHDNSLGLWPGYPSSVRFDELKRAERLVETLWSPEWPEEVFNHPLDNDRVAQGRQLYHAKKCVRCHALINRTDPNRKAKEVLVKIGNGQQEPQEFVGTDPLMAKNFDTMRETGMLEGRTKNFLPLNAKFGRMARAEEILSHVVLGAIIHSPVNEDQELPPQPGFAMAARHPQVYKARPLNGIWATAPFLHNGSVPSLRALLSSDRPKKFWVGHREFSPEDVGFVQDGDQVIERDLFQYDTSKVGNSNQGHVYGAQPFEWSENGVSEVIKALTDEEREALLEFLRSL